MDWDWNSSVMKCGKSILLICRSGRGSGIRRKSGLQLMLHKHMHCMLPSKVALTGGYKCRHRCRPTLHIIELCCPGQGQGVVGRDPNIHYKSQCLVQPLVMISDGWQLGIWSKQHAGFHPVMLWKALRSRGNGSKRRYLASDMVYVRCSSFLLSVNLLLCSSWKMLLLRRCVGVMAWLCAFVATRHVKGCRNRAQVFSITGQRHCRILYCTQLRIICC